MQKKICIREDVAILELKIPSPVRTAISKVAGTAKAVGQAVGGAVKGAVQKATGGTPNLGLAIGNLAASRHGKPLFHNLRELLRQENELKVHKDDPTIKPQYTQIRANINTTINNILNQLPHYITDKNQARELFDTLGKEQLQMRASIGRGSAPAAVPLYMSLGKQIKDTAIRSTEMRAENRRRKFLKKLDEALASI